jgi:hypothetical protein
MAQAMRPRGEERKGGGRGRSREVEDDRGRRVRSLTLWSDDSLAQAEAGQLSFPAGEQGQLSLVEREGDQSVNSRSRESR